MAEIMTDQVQDTNSKINQRIQEEEVITTTEVKIPVEEVVVETNILPKSDGTGIPAIDVEVPKKTRTRVTKTVTAGKVSSVADSIEKMKEKIELLQYVDGVIVPEIALERGNKAGRELLIALQKEVEGIKGKYVEKIQKL